MIGKQKLKKIEIDYKAGEKHEDIAKKHKITPNQLIYLIRKNKWKRESNRSKTHIGNKNAKGNPGNKNASAPKNNKNAVTTGEYETIYKEYLSENELTAWKNIKLNNDNKKKILEDEYKILCIREIRMLERIKKITDKNKDLTIKSITKNAGHGLEYINSGESVTTIAENTDESIQRIEEGLTRVQAQKLKVVSEMHKIYIDDTKLELELLRLEREIASDEPPDTNNSSGENDNSLINALNIKAKEVWSND